MGSTALMWSSSKGNIEITKLLVDAGSDLDYKNNVCIYNTKQYYFFIVLNKYTIIFFIFSKYHITYPISYYYYYIHISNSMGKQP